MAFDIALFCVGLVALYLGAEWLVKGSSSLARSLGITPIVIGLTVVAFGTSAPELVVSLVSALQGKSMIAVGNVIGSNICNIALVLGMAAFLRPLTCARSVVVRDIPIMLGISVCLFFLLLNNHLGRVEGALLFGGVIVYIYINYRLAKRGIAVATAGSPDTTGSIRGDVNEIGDVIARPKQIILIVAGIVGVVAGAQVLIDAAVSLMKVFGVSEKFIGLTVVAFGTSLPELATSVVAALRREMDISIGNLVGSNVFNLLSVLGATALIRPIPITGGFIESGLWGDYCVMLFISFLPWVMMRKASTVNRSDGAVFLLVYGGYLAYLIAGA